MYLFLLFCVCVRYIDKVISIYKNKYIYIFSGYESDTSGKYQIRLLIRLIAIQTREGFSSIPEWIIQEIWL